MTGAPLMELERVRIATEYLNKKDKQRAERIKKWGDVILIGLGLVGCVVIYLLTH